VIFRFALPEGNYSCIY